MFKMFQTESSKYLWLNKMFEMFMTEQKIQNVYGETKCSKDPFLNNMFKMFMVEQNVQNVYVWTEYSIEIFYWNVKDDEYWMNRCRCNVATLRHIFVTKCRNGVVSQACLW